MTATVLGRDLALPDGVILKFYAYKATQSLGFITPIIIEFLLFRGETYSQVGVLEGTFMAAWVLSEIPAGYLGDRIGRRGSLFIGTGLSVLAVGTFVFAHSFPVFAIAYVVWALSVAFRSGAGDAWLYDILKERYDPEAYSKIRGRGQSIYLVTTAIAAILGSYLASISWTLPFVVNSVLLSLGLVVLLTFPRSGPHLDSSDDDPLAVLDALPKIREKFTEPPLRSFVLYAALFFGLIGVVRTFVQPVSTSLGVDVTHLGFMYAGFNALSAVVSYNTDVIDNHVGVHGWFAIAPFVVAGGFLATAFVPLIAIPAFFLVEPVRVVSSTFRGQYVNDYSESVGRATVLSSVTMVSALVAAAARLLGGVVADATSPIAMLALAGGTFCALSLALFAWESPVQLPPVASLVFTRSSDEVQEN